jgi:hypothetical protein
MNNTAAANTDTTADWGGRPEGRGFRKGTIAAMASGGTAVVISSGKTATRLTFPDGTVMRLPTHSLTAVG